MDSHKGLLEGKILGTPKCSAFEQRVPIHLCNDENL